MKKYFIIALVIYFVSSVVGLFLGDYEVIEGWGNRSRLMLYLGIVAILLSAVFMFYYVKCFPRYYMGRHPLAKIMMPLLAATIYFGFNMGHLKWINAFHIKGSITINGIIVDRYQEKTRTGSSYYMYVEDEVSHKTYKFSVSKKAWSLLENTNIFNKEFKIGCLGILYRNKP